MDGHLLRFNTTDEIVFIDVETFNLCLNICNNLPWQISMLKVKGHEIIDSKDMYVKWDTDLKISKEAAEITRFDPNKLDRLGIPPKEAFDAMYEWLNSSYKIIGHNILNFDIYLIRGLCEKFGKPWQHLVDKIIDTNCIARGIKYGEIPNKGDDLIEYQYRLANSPRKGVKTNLTSLGKEFSIDHEYDRLHDAIIDLKLNLKVWNKLKYMIDL
jgi:DNA polymerase III epsilon subunit-like protein